MRAGQPDFVIGRNDAQSWSMDYEARTSERRWSIEL